MTYNIGIINHGLVFNWFVIELAEELQKFVEDLDGLNA